MLTWLTAHDTPDQESGDVHSAATIRRRIADPAPRRKANPPSRQVACRVHQPHAADTRIRRRRGCRPRRRANPLGAKPLAELAGAERRGTANESREKSSCSSPCCSKSGRVDSNHRPLRPENRSRCSQTTTQPVASMHVSSNPTHSQGVAYRRHKSRVIGVVRGLRG